MKNFLQLQQVLFLSDFFTRSNFLYTVFSMLLIYIMDWDLIFPVITQEIYSISYNKPVYSF